MIFNILQHIVRAFVRVLYRVRVEGRGNFPAAGGVVLCANHTFMKDLIIIGSIAPRKIHWMAKAELFRNPFLNWLFTRLGAFPVDRGAHDRDSIKTVYNVLRSGKTLGIFPEGTRILDPNDRPPFKRGFVSFAANSGATILPVAMRYDGGPFGRGRLFSRSVLYFGEAITLDKGRKYNRGELDEVAASVTSWIHSRLGDGSR